MEETIEITSIDEIKSRSVVSSFKRSDLNSIDYTIIISFLNEMGETKYKAVKINNIHTMDTDKDKDEEKYRYAPKVWSGHNYMMQSLESLENYLRSTDILDKSNSTIQILEKYYYSTDILDKNIHIMQLLEKYLHNPVVLDNSSSSNDSSSSSNDSSSSSSSSSNDNSSSSSSNDNSSSSSNDNSSSSSNDSSNDNSSSSNYHHNGEKKIIFHGYTDTVPSFIPTDFWTGCVEKDTDITIGNNVYFKTYFKSVGYKNGGRVHVLVEAVVIAII